MLYAYDFDTITGRIRITADEKAIVGIGWPKGETGETNPRPLFKKTPLIAQAEQELKEYFSGRRTRFSVPVAPSGTPFQRRVWDELCRIPYGETLSYGQVAANIGNPRASRAVGMANHNNPIAIIIPCHRVIGADGSMTGFGAGVDIKKRLLALEKSAVERDG